MGKVETILSDKSLKGKTQTELLAKLILKDAKELDSVMSFAKTAKDPIKGTCIEAIEQATRINPKIAGKKCLDFIVANLSAKAPRVKWESARVIANIAEQFPGKLDEAIIQLLNNAEDPGTVVRWSSATALGQILIHDKKSKKLLLPALQAIAVSEEKNSIRKIYLAAINQRLATKRL